MPVTFGNAPTPLRTTPTQPAAPSSVSPLGASSTTTPLSLPRAPYGNPASTPAPLSGAPTLTPTNPASDLRSQTISAGPTANRMNIANTYEQNWNAQTAPQYQADLRTATSQAAGAGQLGSGQLRTSLGDLAYNRDVQRNADESNFLNTALNGSIQDAYNNVGIAQQQQQFQAGLQNQTFNQGLQALLAGESGNPADTQLALSQLYGSNAAQAGQGLSGLIGNTVNNNTQQATLQQMLQSLGIGGNVSINNPSPVGTPIYNTGTVYNGATG